MNPHQPNFGAEFPCIFPLLHMSINQWSSLFNIDDQLFVVILQNSLLFISLHSDLQKSATGLENSINDSVLEEQIKQAAATPSSPMKFSLSKRDIVKLFAHKNPFATKLRTRKRAMFTGVVTFEVQFKNFVGFAFSNTLFNHGKNFCIEMKTTTKRVFKNLPDMFSYFGFPFSSPHRYQPNMNSAHSRIILHTTYPYQNQVSCLFESDFFRSMTDRPRRLSLFKKEDEAVKRNLANTFDSSGNVSESKEELVNFETEIKDKTLIGYFDDPILPYAFHRLIHHEKNKRLLNIYEESIPAWCTFLASYGFPYKPWLRFGVKYFFFSLSLFTMVLGFYDLYKHVPTVRTFFKEHFGAFFDWVQDHLTIRLSILFGWILSQSSGIKNFVALLFTSRLGTYIVSLVNVLMMLIEGLLTPLTMVLDTFREVGEFVLEIGSFFVFGLQKTVTVATSLIKLVVYLPSMSLLHIISALCYSVYKIFMILRYLVQIIFCCCRAASPATEILVETQANVLTFTMFKDFWLSVLNRVFKGIKSIYDFLINLIAMEIAKHKWSIRLWAYRKFREKRVRFYIWKAEKGPVLEKNFKKFSRLLGLGLFVFLAYKMWNWGYN